MTEPKLVLKIRKALEAEGAYAAKIHGGRYSVGVPDILVCYKGRFYGFEVKLPGKEKNLTALQRTQLQGIRDAGGQAWVITSVEEATYLIGARPTQPKGVYVYGDSG